MSFRQIVTERDLSSFVVGNNNEVGGFVIKSRKGPTFPVLIRNYDDFITWFGEPNQDFWGGYEVLNYLTTAPAWVTRIVGNGYKHAGVDVRTDRVTSFGADTGRTLNTFDYNSLPLQKNAVLKSGSYEEGSTVVANGINSTYSGFIFDELINSTFEPSTSGNLRIKIINQRGQLVRELKNVSVSSGLSATRSITATGLVTGESTINKDTGAVTLSFEGTEGNIFRYLSGKTYSSISDSISLLSTVRYSLYLIIEGVIIDGGNLEIPNEIATVEELIDLLNERIDASEIGRDDLVYFGEEGDEEGHIVIEGTKGDSSMTFKLRNGSDETIYKGKTVETLFEDEGVYQNALTVNAGVIYTIAPTSPPTPTNGVNYFPKNGDTIHIDYIIEEDASSVVSHSFFATSPYDDSQFDYRVAIQYTPEPDLEDGNRIYTLTLFQIVNKANYPIAQYTYSLDKIKDNQGKSIYIEDVFRNNPYLIPFINLEYPTDKISTVNEGAIIVPSLSVRLTGGKKGEEPTSTEVTKAWAFYRKAKRYKINLFVDIYGGLVNVSAIKDLLLNYQKYAFGITIVPFNLDPQQAIEYRQSLGLDNDKMSLYHNWEQIADVLNGGSLIWVSGMGKVGTAFANMIDIFDAESPAGINENGIGGQLINGYQAVAVQYDYDDYYLKALDDSQINPKVLDPIYGLVLKGDRTLRVTRGDTAYIAARRLYNYILSNIIDQVLTLQEFRLNDTFHRTRMTELCTQIIQPILNSGYLREARIICDETNNTDEVLNRREFVVDVLVKVTPNSQVIRLNFIRLSQTQSVANVL